MGHVQVPAEDHGLDLVQLAQVLAEIVLPDHPVVDALQAPLGVGSVAAHQVEALIFCGDDPALVAVDVVPEAVSHRQGLRPGEDGGAGVALLIGVVPVHVVAGELQLHLALLDLGLLEAVHVRPQGLAGLQKALFQTGPQAVDVP